MSHVPNKLHKDNPTSGGVTSTANRAFRYGTYHCKAVWRWFSLEVGEHLSHILT